MDYLTELENRTVYILREGFHLYKKTALLWSIGKDSTTLLWLSRKAFFGKLPFPVLHIDTGWKFEEIYRFRDEWARRWGVDLIVHRNEDAIRKGVGPEQGRFECCSALKTEALREVLEKYDFRALFLGIRRDEHGIRAKERYFSPRDGSFAWDFQNQPPELWDLYLNEARDGEHLRIHPLLGWREIDIWRYIEREHIPVTDLYFSRNGKRYRSIGCEPCCEPVPSQADTTAGIIEELEQTRVSERSGRAQDKESAYMMQKLRSLGYM